MTRINYIAGSLTALTLCLGLGQAFAAPVAAIGEPQKYRTTYDDTLLDLARKFDVGYVEIVAANPGLDPWVPGADKEVTIPAQHLLPQAVHEGIVINVAEMRLYYYPAKDGTPQTYPIGIGEQGAETPFGSTKVMRKQAHPTWYRTKNEIKNKPWAPKIVPPGPDNPLGEYALYLGWPSYLIHGTDDWRRVGRRDSRGCVGMYPEDIERMFREVPIGTKVTVVNQPIKFAWIDGRLFMEAYPTPDQADQLEMENIADFEDPVDVTKTILAAAGPAADKLDWAAVRQAANNRDGIPVAITR